MNIFYFDYDVNECVRQMADIHVGSKEWGGKMIVETAQLLSLAFPLERLAEEDCPRTQKGTPRKHFNPNHPCGLWTVEDYYNWSWLLDLAYAMMRERKHRGAETEHYCKEFFDWCNKQMPDLPVGCFSDPPACVREDLIDRNVVQSYRNCYLYDKSETMELKWTNRKIPEWMNPCLTVST